MQDAVFFQVADLKRFIERLFASRGVEPAKTRAIAQSLVGADVIGRATHGVVLAPAYLDAAAAGRMAVSGEATVVSDRGASFAWAGNRLPGAWLIHEAVELAVSRVATYGTVMASIGNGFHTGALAVCLQPVVERGLLGVLSCSSPGARWVAPFGGTGRLFSTNPMAAAIPTGHDPILLDVSSSITTVNRTRQLAKAGSKFPGEWGLDSRGLPTDEPAEVLDGGALLPVGGLDHGHKGYALALLVEALTSGLSGTGRVTIPGSDADPMVTNICLQVIDPEAFGGTASFLQEMAWVSEACKTNPPRGAIEAVRVPGDRAQAALEAALVAGVGIPRGVLAALAECAASAGVDLPDAIAPALLSSKEG